MAGLKAEEPVGVVTPPIRIAVFDLEFDDRSAGAGLVAPDPLDQSYLEQSTAEARQLLAETGRYEIVDASGVAQQNLVSCGGCEAGLAQKLGASTALIGLVTRITRTEYTIQLRVIDAETKETLSNAFTGLRLGANYSWPRGVRSLMKQRTLVTLAEK